MVIFQPVVKGKFALLTVVITSYSIHYTKLYDAKLFALEEPGNIYTRIMNPTNDVLEQRLAALEGGVAGLVVSAGSAAINYAIQTLAQAGDNIVSTPQLYGGTYTLFAHQLPSFGVEVRFAKDRNNFV